MNKIEVPNTDPLLDPSFAEYQARRAFGGHLDAAVELRDYGRDLLKRLMSSCVDSLPDLVVVAGLLRQLVVSLDGWLLCASAGASQAARVHLRGCLESYLYMEWILTRGKDRWARQLYIANVRSNRRSTRRIIPGTEENRLLAEAWQKAYGHAYVADPQAIEAAKQQDSNAQDTLELAVYDPINRGFEAFVACHKREPDWYEVGDGAVTSLFALATELGRRVEYFILYESFSEATHGDRTDLHFTKDSSGSVHLEPVRDASKLENDAGLAVSLPARAFLLLLGYYRPEERPVFAANQMTRWRQFMDTPKVKVNRESVPLY